MRISPVSAVPAGLIALTVAVATLSAPSSAHSPAPAIAAPQASAPACSLTPAQERTALDAFDKMLPVLFHPRCLNCHGGLNPYVDPQVGRHVGGRMTDSATGEPLRADACQECHGELPGWDTPGGAMFFTGKSPRDLCIQFKEFAPTGGAEFVTTSRTNPQVRNSSRPPSSARARSTRWVKSPTRRRWVTRRRRRSHRAPTSSSSPTPRAGPTPSAPVGMRRGSVAARPAGRGTAPSPLTPCSTGPACPAP